MSGRPHGWAGTGKKSNNGACVFNNAGQFTSWQVEYSVPPSLARNAILSIEHTAWRAKRRLNNSALACDLKLLFSHQAGDNVQKELEQTQTKLSMTSQELSSLKTTAQQAQREREQVSKHSHQPTLVDLFSRKWVRNVYAHSSWSWKDCKVKKLRAECAIFHIWCYLNVSTFRNKGNKKTTDI